MRPSPPRRGRPGEGRGALERPAPGEPDADCLKYRLEHLAFLALAAGQVDRERQPAAVGHQVQLGAEAPA